jgi:hypothetical protein
LKRDGFSLIQGRARDVRDVDDTTQTVIAADEAAPTREVIGLDGTLHYHL